MKTWTFTNLRKRTLFSAFLLFINFLFVAAGSVLILVNSSKFPLAVPLWYSKPWGEGWLAEPNYLWLIPTFSFISILINFTVAKILDSEEEITNFILTGGSLITGILFFYTLLEIVFVTT